MRTDQYKHFFACFAITALGTVPWQIWQRMWMLWIPVALGLMAGFYKEFKDIKGTGFDWTDILADVAGVVAAMAMLGFSAIGG